MLAPTLQLGDTEVPRFGLGTNGWSLPPLL
jgi:hypothetical protein